MSEISEPHEPCPICRKVVCTTFAWQCECGMIWCCNECAPSVHRYHQSGECGLAAEFNRLMEKDD